MPLTLRFDVDKPYGCRGLFHRVISKVREDYYFPQLDWLEYLADQAALLEYLNGAQVRAIFYHRLCTLPNPRIIQLLSQGKHHFGLHVENTRTYATLAHEVAQFKKSIHALSIHSFSKHGSGVFKLGRHHYPPYEPEKYYEWSKQLNIPYYFGNGQVSAAEEFNGHQRFWPAMFWLEPTYRMASFNDVNDCLAAAESKHVVVLSHPENFVAQPQVKLDLIKLIEGAKNKNIPWSTLE